MRNTFNWIAGLILLGLCLGLPACLMKPVSRPAQQAPGKKILMMHYMPWYETPAIRGEWGSHWTGHDGQHHPDNKDARGLPDIWSHYHPLIGLYDSKDPAVLECHLLQMKLAGIDGVIVDWYGIGDAADYPKIHAATCAMFDAAGQFGMKFVACYEDRSIKLMVDWNKLPPENVPAHLTQTLQWMQQEWFSKPQYLRLHNRPLLLNWGAGYLNSAAVWSHAMEALAERPAFFGLHHLWKQVGADGGFTWVHFDPWEGAPTAEQIRQRIGEVFTYFSTDPRQVIVSACPGFKDVYKEHLRSLDYRGGETLRAMLEVGMAGAWPLIQLVTWNDYGEGTMIEPTHEFGYTFLEIIQQERRKELGAAFTFSADDLRLPARLYALRKAGGTSPAVLNRISRWLSEGACQKARKEISHYEAIHQAPMGSL